MLARLEEERVRGRPRRHPRPGGGARADRPGPARRGQPGADRDPAAPAGRGPRRPARAALGAQGDPDARHPGDGGAADARPHAAPDRARRPRPRPRARSQVADFGERTGIRSTFHRHGEPPDLVRRGAARALPRHAGEPVQRRPALGRRAPCASSSPPSAAPSCACATTAAASSPAAATAASASPACASAHCSSAGA